MSGLLPRKTCSQKADVVAVAAAVETSRMVLILKATPILMVKEMIARFVAIHLNNKVRESGIADADRET